MAAWRKFFLDCGIPSDVANNYAQSFVKNRITKEILPDLDKAALTDLGVNAIGDQLAILRRLKEKPHVETAPVKPARSVHLVQIGSHQTSSGPTNSKMRVRISAPDGSDDVSSSSAGCPTLASTHRKGRPAPDRHEIYHIKLPQGNTERSRKIIAKMHQMKRAGIPVRGSGVRQAGRSVSPVGGRPARVTVPPLQVSTSHINDLSSRLGVRGLHSDNSESRVIRTIPQQHTVRTGFVAKRQVINTNVQGRLSGTSVSVSMTRGGRRGGTASRLSRTTNVNQRVQRVTRYAEEEDDDVEYEDNDMEYVEFVEEGESTVFDRLSY